MSNLSTDRLNHKTAWLQLVTSLFACVGGLLIFINQQPQFIGMMTSQLKHLTMEKDPNATTAETYYQRGLQLVGKDDKGAMAAYTKAIELKADFAFSYDQRGSVKNRLGDRRGAIEDYSKAIELKPDFSIAYSSRGIVRGNLGDKKGAVEDYNVAVKLRIDSGQSYDNWGIFWQSIGDKKAAIDDFNKAAELYKRQGDNNRYKAALDRANKLSK
jgi:tetratricopeptide (TPR) repeat protein